MKLFYRKYGDGPPLIIIHGLYGASDNWVTVGKELASEFEVYILDQRNHGRSNHSVEHNYDLMKDDLLEFMDDQSIEKAVILGHSMGGKTAMYFALKFPDKISSLIIVDIAPKSYSNVESNHIKTINHNQIVNAMLSVDFRKIKTREDADRDLEKIIKSVRVRQFLLKNLHRNKDNTFNWSLNLKAINENLNAILEGIDEKEMLDGKEVIGFPILFIRGSLSNYILDDDIPTIRSIFPYADIQTIENTGHWVHAEKPKELAQKIKKFVLD